MPTSQMNGVIQHLRRAGLLRDGAGLTDGQLLEDYISRRDDAALAALVRRHGPMVWGVCRRVLGNYHDAEDAFQATFLVLVRKAASIASRELLANWLYGVAHQTALKARATIAKRRTRERQVREMLEPEATQQQVWHDLQPLLDEELSRLPDKYRVPIVLCDLEGKTRNEAAQLLGCPEGTVAGRLARARVMLAKRLAQRGVTLSGGALAAVLAEKVLSADVPTSVVSSTIKVASLLAAGKAAGEVSVKVAALAEGVVKTMFATKIKSVLTAVMALAALAGGAGLLYRSQAAEPPKGKAQKVEEKPAPAQPTPPPAKTDQERIVGAWVIVNEDSNRKGEPWSINKDKLIMHTNYKYYNYLGFWIDPPAFVYRLDAGKTPKQIDIGVAKDSVRIKGIYVLDGDELRLCLAQPDKDRPAAFPAKPARGEVLILHREKADAERPKAKEEQPAKSDLERMIGDWVIANADSKYKTDMSWTITADRIHRHSNIAGFQPQWYHRIDASKDPKQIDIAWQLNGPTTIKGIYALDGDELRLCLGDAGKDRPAAFPEKPKPGDLTILKRAKPVDVPTTAKQVEKPLHFVEKPDMKPQFGWLPHKVEGQVTAEDIYVPSKAFIADICNPGKTRIRDLIDPRYLKKHGLTDRDIAYEILDHQGLNSYQVADDVRTILFNVNSKGGGKELIMVRWVLYEGRLYISPEKAPDPKTGIFKPWILRTKVN